MKEATKINACAFFVKDDEGQIREAGIAAFEKLHSAIKIEIRVFKEDAREKMVRDCPPGGTAIVDKMTDGRIELIASEMDDSIPFSSITSVIDVLREKFDVPIIDVPKPKTIAIRPNPAKS